MTENELIRASLSYCIVEVPPSSPAFVIFQVELWTLVSRFPGFSERGDIGSFIPD
jgi:hypothetical protein